MPNELALTAALNKPSVPVTRTQQLLYVLIEARPRRASHLAHAPAGEHGLCAGPQRVDEG